MSGLAILLRRSLLTGFVAMALRDGVKNDEYHFRVGGPSILLLSDMNALLTARYVDETVVVLDASIGRREVEYEE